MATQASRIRRRPIPSEDDAQSTGKIFRSATSVRRPGSRSAGSRVPCAKNFSISPSSPSATSSTSFSCSAFARSAMSSGIGPSTRLPLSWKWASMRTRSTVPLKVRSSPNGNLEGDDAPSEALLEHLHDPVEGRAFPVHPIDDEEDGPVELGGELPRLLRLHLDPGDGVENDDHRVGRRGGGARLRGEDPVARSVEKVDPHVPVHRVRDGEVDGDSSLDLFAVEVRRTGAFLDLARPRGGTGSVQKARDERGFSDGVVPENGDISQLGSGKDFHGARIIFTAMTAVSCLAIGLAFALAVALLVLAGVVIGLMPAWWRRSRRRGPAPGKIDPPAAEARIRRSVASG